VHQSVDRGAPGAGHEPCGAKTRGGGTCKLRAGQGTDHLGVGRCKLHGGSTPNHVAAARRQQAEQAVVDGIDRALVWERPSVWLELYERERKHLAAVAKTCVDVGVEERRVQLAEQHGALLARVIDGIAADLGVKDDPRFPAVVRRHLTLVQPAA
jgi:2-phospho-L-lactate guanylyltransferase (CobY/MobA/RfbA family)